MLTLAGGGPVPAGVPREEPREQGAPRRQAHREQQPRRRRHPGDADARRASGNGRRGRAESQSPGASPRRGAGNLFGRGDSADGLRAGRYKAIAAAERAREAARSGKPAAFRVWRPHPSTARRRRGLARRLVLAPRVRVQAAPPHAPDGRERRRRVPERGGLRLRRVRRRCGPRRRRRAAEPRGLWNDPSPRPRPGGSERGDGRGSFDARAGGPVRGRRLERFTGDTRDTQGALLVDALGQKPVADWW